MSATLMARGGPIRSQSTEILCTGSYSIVVEGADGEPPEDNLDEDFDDEVDSPFLDAECAEHSEGGCESLLSSPRMSRRGSRRGSKSSTKEETENKLAFFKTEAAARLSELERLLDEHDQIVRELKRSESISGLHVMGTSHAGSGIKSAPNPATPVDGGPPSIVPSIVISRTAPASPTKSIKPRPPE